MISRRGFIAGAAGCSVAAAPGVGPFAFAAAPGERRLIVLILRGAMDGLGLVQPHGDPGLKALRRTLALTPDTGLLDLDGFFGLHTAGASGGAALADLWRAGELAFVHAVSTPYRGRRSHFEGQDVLEAGIGAEGRRDRGWLPRALALVPGADPARAVTMSGNAMVLGRADTAAATIANWSPWAGLDPDHRLKGALGALHAGDPAFAAATGAAFRIAGEIGPAGDAASLQPHLMGAHALVRMLVGEARVAAMGLGGWDTHVGQRTALKAPIHRLGEVLAYLKQGLGLAWAETAVLCMTEFGRTARENGVGGTDHGTGGVAVLAGGAVRGGQVLGEWPGLGEGDLLEDRDLRPTGDVRLYAAMLIHQLLGAPMEGLARDVFPGIEVPARLALLA